MIQNIRHTLFHFGYTTLFKLIHFVEQKYGKKVWTHSIRKKTYFKMKDAIEYLESRPLNNLGLRGDVLTLHRTKMTSLTNEINQYVKGEINRLLKNTYKKQIYLEKELLYAKDIRFLSRYLEHNIEKTNAFEESLYVKERQAQLDMIRFIQQLKEEL